MSDLSGFADRPGWGRGRGDGSVRVMGKRTNTHARLLLGQVRAPTRSSTTSAAQFRRAQGPEIGDPCLTVRAPFFCPLPEELAPVEGEASPRAILVMHRAWRWHLLPFYPGSRAMDQGPQAGPHTTPSPCWLHSHYSTPPPCFHLVRHRLRALAELGWGSSCPLSDTGHRFK